MKIYSEVLSVNSRSSFSFGTINTIASIIYSTGSRIPEYCQTETFNASCPHGKVIQMTEARYGRMALGRCVRTDFGFLGCLSDVLAPLDKRCSGRQRCEVRIPDSALDNSQPCLGDLTRYLEADYSCISGRVKYQIFK